VTGHAVEHLSALWVVDEDRPVVVRCRQALPRGIGPHHIAYQRPDRTREALEGPKLGTIPRVPYLHLQGADGAWGLQRSASPLSVVIPF
jgi:hypothetical protein